MDISKGDFLIDNDPRMNNRRLTVVDLDDNYVWATDVGGRRFRYKKSRIHCDGLIYRSGLSLVKRSRSLDRHMRLVVVR